MPKSILIVDDAASMRGLVAITLKTAGYEVVEAADGQDALGKLSGAARFDLILTDLNMPNLDGIGFVKQLKLRPEHRFTPVIMLTTESEAQKMKQGQAAGAKAWVVKPFKPEQLLAAVSKLILP